MVRELVAGIGDLPPIGVEVSLSCSTVGVARDLLEQVQAYPGIGGWPCPRGRSLHAVAGTCRQARRLGEYVQMGWRGGLMDARRTIAQSDIVTTSEDRKDPPCRTAGFVPPRPVAV